MINITTKIFKTSTTLALILSASLLTGCGSSEESQIKEGIELDIKKKYYRELTNPSAEIKALENVGTQVAPSYNARFVAKVELVQPRYKKVKIASVPGTEPFTIVEQVYNAGEKVTAFGTSTSTLRAEQFITSAKLTSFDVDDIGDLLEDFSRPIIQGTESYDAVMDEINRINSLRDKAVLGFRKTLIGKWEGTYNCSNSDYGFTLDIVNIYNHGDMSQTNIEAIFHGASGPDPFKLAGTLEVDGSFKLNPTEWVNKGSSGNWAGFHGRFFEATNTITGDVTQNWNCGEFKLSRN